MSPYAPQRANPADLQRDKRASAAMSHDDYLELIENARDALYALLKETDTALPCITIREAYRICRDELAKGRGQPSPAELAKQAEQEREREEQAIWDRWKNTPRHERWRTILDALGDSTWPISALAARVDEMRDDWRVFTPAVQAELYKMIAAGEVQREKRPWRHEQTCWHYSRRRNLEGPIADLDAAFRTSAAPDDSNDDGGAQ